MYTLIPCSLSTSFHVSESPCWDAVDARMRPALHRKARCLLDHEQDAEDAVQETFLRAWNGSLRDPGALEGWMHVVVRHVAYDMVRRRAVRQALSLDAEEVDPPVDRRELRPDTRLTVHDAVSLLPVGQAHVLRAAVEGHAMADIAGTLGITTTAVKTRLSRVRMSLRRGL